MVLSTLAERERLIGASRRGRPRRWRAAAAVASARPIAPAASSAAADDAVRVVAGLMGRCSNIYGDPSTRVRSDHLAYTARRRPHMDRATSRRPASALPPRCDDDVIGGESLLIDAFAAAGACRGVRGALVGAGDLLGPAAPRTVLLSYRRFPVRAEPRTRRRRCLQIAAV